MKGLVDASPAAHIVSLSRCNKILRKTMHAGEMIVSCGVLFAVLKD